MGKGDVGTVISGQESGCELDQRLVESVLRVWRLGINRGDVYQDLAGSLQIDGVLGVELPVGCLSTMDEELQGIRD
ncbi:hypothetical protein Droror1_Dr00027433 [Drosera rotundifolia]